MRQLHKANHYSPTLFLISGLMAPGMFICTLRPSPVTDLACKFKAHPTAHKSCSFTAPSWQAATQVFQVTARGQAA